MATILNLWRESKSLIKHTPGYTNDVKCRPLHQQGVSCYYQLRKLVAKKSDWSILKVIGKRVYPIKLI